MRRTALFENGWVALALVGVSAVFVTMIGYFDEGNHLIFAGFGDYLAKGGVPPASDYVLWGVIFVVLGVILFHLQSLVPRLQTAFATRLIVSVLAIPALILGLLALLVAA